MLCSARITLGERRETYCMRQLGHPGDHSIHPDEKQPSLKVAHEDPKGSKYSYGDPAREHDV